MLILARLERTLVVCVLFFLPLNLAATELQRIAESIGVGSWAEVQTQGFDERLLVWGGRHAFQYADGMVWDPVAGKLHFVGAGHQVEIRHLVYSEASNSWAQRPLPGIGLSHAYDHMGIDVIGRAIFFRTYGTKYVNIFDINTGSWRQSTSAAVSYIRVASGVEWFPEIGRLVHVDDYNNVMLYNPSSDSWSSLSVTLNGLGPYHNFAEYSDVHGVVIFGGGNGSRTVYRLDEDRAVTRMQDAPVNLGITASVITVDPVDGNFLVIASDGRFFEYDPISDVWSQLPSSVPSALLGRSGSGEWGLVATPISTYGLVAYARSSYSGGEGVYVYRHRAGVGKPIDTMVPRAPSNLIVKP